MFSSFPLCWAGWAWGKRHQAWVPHTYLAVFLVLAYLSSVQLPRWQTQSHQSVAPQLKALCLPTNCFGSYLTCPALRLLVHLSLCGAVSSISLHLCPPAQVTPCVLTFMPLSALAPASPMAQSTLPSPLLLFSADPSLKACPQTASSMQPF